ncbi:MAG TPA: ABC transporter substrate binding protein [Gammaproteobacteria bacterium]|nr:ABC transporter substrate binding protein [Gammaproteobacteria bacterium]
MFNYLYQKIKLTRSGLIYFTLAFIFIIFIPIWVISVGPQLKKIPKNFTYSADIFSLNNLYDEHLKKFEGDRISKTVFKYRVISEIENYLVVEVTFNVRRLNDTPIFSVTRLYYIDPYNGKHVAINDLKRRDGYLFGPRNADKSDYYYWHINYDAPALLKFVKSEKINGLTVYKYYSHYVADQTENLGYLQGIPDKRGIKTNINLYLWIEPISGWLIQYQDNTFAYYYDRITGKYIAPWNKFTNGYTQTSLINNVRYATFLKCKYITVDFIVPFIFSLVSASFFWLGYKKTKLNFDLLSVGVFLKKIEQLTISVSIILLILITAAEFSYYFFVYKKTSQYFKVGISQWNNNATYLEAIKGFKDGLAEDGIIENNNVKFYIKNPNTSVQKQIGIVQSFVNQKVDLIYTLTTPGTLIAKGITKNVPIVFSFVVYPEKVNLVYSLKTSRNNLVGSINYIPASQQFYYFERLYPNIKTLGFVRHKGDESSEIQLAEYKVLLSKRNIQLIDIAVIDIFDLSKLLGEPLRFDALYLACDSFMQGNGGRVVIDISKKNKIPTFSCNKDNVFDGVLIGYVADPYVVGKTAGKKAALILRGAEPTWLYTESPQQGYLIVNTSTAKLLGVSIPEDVLQKSDYITGQ